MAESTLNGQEFSERLTKIIEANLKNEQFGVTQLVHEMKMSHSSLHRAVKNAAGLTISQFICMVRLKNAQEILKQNPAITVSEVAYACGFHSVTYFNKCFHDFYGFSPGEAKKQTEPKNNAPKTPLPLTKQKKWLLASVLLSALLIILFFTHEQFNIPVLPENKPLEKTIAVLPFKNDSPDSTNAYFINGLMESILNNLSNIEDLNVRSRTSVEKFREGNKSLKEIAKELNVDYLVEGNGQKYGDEVLLNIQLIEANTDRHLFSEQYRKEIREVKDFIDLQSEIALNIVSKINAELSPEEEQNIKEIPTENMAAYNLYLRGLDYLRLAKQSPLFQFSEDIYKAKSLFEDAIKLDTTFSLAYSWLAHIYIDNLWYWAGANLADRYLDTGIILVNNALKYDAANVFAQSVKGTYYNYKGMYKEAEAIFEDMEQKQRDLPGTWETQFNFYRHQNDIYNAIKSFYKYLELKEENLPPYIIQSITMCLTNAGFPELRQKYARELTRLYNDSAGYLRLMGLTEMYSGDFETADQYYSLAYKMDSLDIGSWSGLMSNHLFREEYADAAVFLQKIENAGNNHQVSIATRFFGGYAALKSGRKTDAEIYFKNELKNFLNTIELNTPAAQRFESHFFIAVTYAALEEKEKALEYLSILNNIENVPYNYIMVLQKWPGFEIIREESEFLKLENNLVTKYQKEHERIGKLLKELGEIES
ncbi:helix-turn-helix domain-containing protein [Mariniphaga sp.]|uniref:helix-turn-helix domain-containing protein n=1 Tax=Mariniphaga sp. TaxID=1954475 RepID=UPI0035653DA2